MSKIQDMSLKQIHDFVENNYVPKPDYLDLWVALIEMRNEFRSGFDLENPTSNKHVANSNRSFGFSTAMEIVAEHLNIEMEY